MSHSSTDLPILDVDDTLTRFGGDRDLFVEMIGMLLDDAPPLTSKLRDAGVRQDAAGVRMHAHALKGLIAGCGGKRAAFIAQQLENAGEQQDISGARDLLPHLDSEMEQLMKALDTYRSNV